MGSGRWRLKRPKDAAVSFMENRTTLGDVVEYDAGRDEWVDKKESDAVDERVLLIWKDGDEEVEKLFVALEKYYAKMEKHSTAGTIITRVDVKKWKWDEVFDRISDAADQYENEGARGSKGIIKRTLRAITAHAPAMQQWVNLIPSGDYGSVVVGSFQMFLTAAQRSTDIRKSVQDVMAEIPYIMNRNRDLLELYKTRPRDALTRAVAELFKGVLRTLRLVVEYLTHSSAGRGFKALVRGDDFEVELSDSIETVRQLADRTTQEANVAHQDRTRRIEEMVNQQIGPQQLASMLHSLLISNPNFSKDTGKGRFLQTPQITISISESEREPTPKPSDPGPSRKKILRALDFDVDSPASDIEECRKAQYTLGLHAKDEATYIIQSKKMKRWLTKSDKSRDLLVSGNRPDSAMEDISPVSLVCAELISLFSLSKSAVVVSYFCGLHADIEDDASDWVPEMIKSLICQLLAQPKDRKLKWDLSFISEKDIEKMQDNDLEKLLKVFRRLVLQLPSDKIFFCILDSISRFEVASEAETDSIEALSQLTALVGKKKKVMMKLLLTSPSDSGLVGDDDMEKEVIVGDMLVVPDAVDGDMQNVLNLEGVEDSILLS